MAAISLLRDARDLRYDASKMRVQVGGDGWYLCDWRDLPDHQFTQFRGGERFARQWVDQFRGDFLAFSALRSLLGGAFPQSDDQIAREVAWRIASGAWMARRRVVRRAAGVAGKPAEVAAPFPKEDRRPARPASPPPQDAPLFPEDIDAAAIAEAQKQAAASGVPFCEECVRAAMAGSG
jgi:hypothetical protein